MVDIEDVARDAVDTAIKVHKNLGPGLLESAYQQCHAFELRQRGRKVLTEVSLPLTYEGQLMTYLKLSGRSIGFLLNWNVTLMKHGIKRLVMNLCQSHALPQTLQKRLTFSALRDPEKTLPLRSFAVNLFRRENNS